MRFVSRPPAHPLLQGLVDRVWWSAAQPANERHEEWILPTCRAQIILAPSASVFVGPKMRAEKIERRTGVPMVGLSLAAGAASAFVGHGGHETGGVTAPLDAMMTLGSLPARLGAMAGDEALDVVEADMAGRLSPVSLDPAVIAAERGLRSGQPASAVMAALGLDRRTFVPRFRHTVGVAPKHYERICRFNRTVRQLRHSGAAPLVSIAATRGYADQAHMTREVRHFGLTTPSLIHRDGAAMVNHVEPDKIFKT